MKKLFSLICVGTMLLSLCCCSKADLQNLYSDIVKEFEELLPTVTEITEVKNEYYYVRQPQFSICYYRLNVKQKEFYNRLYSVSQEMPEGYVVLGDYYEDALVDVRIAYYALLSDNAEIFWMPNSYVVATVKKMGKQQLAVAFSYSDGENKKEYPISKAERDKCAVQLEKAVDEIINKAKKLKGDYQKELFFNDYICENVTYKEEGTLVNTAYGALVLKTALCEGYSRAFKLLCNKVGIECDLVVGHSNGEGHMWNRVNIDKKHSYVDVTWNDSTEYKNHIYFNITDRQISKTHKFNPVLSKLSNDEILENTSFNFEKFECTFTGNTYYAKNNQVLWIDYVTDAVNGIKKAIKNGENYAEFMFATEKSLNLFESDPDGFLNEIQYNLSGVTLNSYIHERDVLMVFFD